MFILVAALVLRLASSPTADISYGLIALYALKGREQALHALFLGWLFSMLNGAFAPDASAATVGRYAVLIAAATSMVLRKPSVTSAKGDRSLVHLTLLFGGLIIVHSLIFSSMPDVSVLKAISWTLAMATLLAGWAGLNDDQRVQLSQQLFCGLTLVMLASIAVLPFPAAYISGAGFMGILGHSQSFGIAMALLGAWTALRALAVPRPSWALIIMILLCMGLVLLSGARTAALALLLGMTFALLLGPTLSGKPRRQLMPGLHSRRIQLTIVLVLAGMAVAWPRLVDESMTFISKNADAQNIGQAYQMSRGGLIDAMWLNIENNPWQGIGFGIATIPDLMVVSRDPIFDLPVSALVEKGVLPVAVLEELGLPGFVFFTFWLLVILKRCVRQGLPALAVFLVVLFLNMGEAIFFSAGGMGMLAMLLIAWAATGSPMRSGRV